MKEIIFCSFLPLMKITLELWSTLSSFHHTLLTLPTDCRWIIPKWGTRNLSRSSFSLVMMRIIFVGDDDYDDLPWVIRMIIIFLGDDGQVSVFPAPMACASMRACLNRRERCSSLILLSISCTTLSPGDLPTTSLLWCLDREDWNK